MRTSTKLLLWVEGMMLFQGLMVWNRPTFLHIFFVPTFFAIGFGLNRLKRRLKR